MVTHAKHRNGQLTRRPGPVSRVIQKQTAKLPPNTFLWIAGGAAAASLALHLMNRKRAGRFIAGWVPAMLMGGLSHRIARNRARTAIR